MAWLSRLLCSSPSPASVSRRGFVAGAGALAGGLLFAEDARASDPEPVFVDAMGLPVAAGDRPVLTVDGLPSEPYLGFIMPVGFNFAPRGWASCNGQILPINTNQSLYSLLGTTYGGDGRTTFGLPDLRGRVPIHEGQGSGLSDFRLGQTGGSEAAPLAAHTHPLPEVQVRGSGTQIVGFPNEGATGTTAATTSTGSTAPNNLQPMLAIHYVISLQGQFPSRN